MKFFLVILSLFLSLQTELLEAKPFKKVLVLSGGSLNPGLAVGLIAGLKEKGWKPDLIISTCGANIGAAINNSNPTIQGSFEVLRSWEFFKLFNQFQIETVNGIEIANKISVAKNTFIYPDIFDHNLLFGPIEFKNILEKNEFNRDPKKEKLIMISARALFGPDKVGKQRESTPLFQQVYFTDPDTAEYLNNVKLPKKRSFPFTTLMSETQAISSIDVMAAARAGVADPYLMNPSIVDGYYQFTGAVDLFPLDLAESLGEEVIATYPGGLFLDYEDVAVNSAFGFKQTDRALEAIQHKNLKWIDVSNSDSVSFNPTRLVVVMQSGIPTDFIKFKLGVAKQWNFGRERAIEALRMAPGAQRDNRFHLRKPINPKLIEKFSCENAFEWKTDQRDFCVNDISPKCDRRIAKTCVPIR